MFKLFKNKIKDAFNKFAKEVDEEADIAQDQEETIEDQEEEKKEQEEIISETKKQKDDEEKEREEAQKYSDLRDEEDSKEEKRGLFSKIFKKKDSEDEEHKAPTLEEIDETSEPEKKEEEEITAEDIADDATDAELELAENKLLNSVRKIHQKSKDMLKGTIEEKDDGKKSIHSESDELNKKEEIQKNENNQDVEEKKSFLNKITDSITKKVLSQRAFNDLFWDLEIILLENNVAVEVIDLIKENLKKELVDKPISRKEISNTIEKTLKNSIEEVFDIESPELLEEIPKTKPYKILVVGVNGSGKTTTIAKLIRLLQKNNFTSTVAAADTFRAAAIDQLQEHADNLGVKLIKHDYNSDPAAVAFDAIKYAQAKGLDSVIIDTAGRLHSNANLMDELKKVYRVSKPDMTIFIGESITGNDCVEQAKEFQKAVDIDAVILSKADIDEKGGAAISVSYVTQRPILYLGVGQEYDDLEEFDKYKIMYRIFGDSLED